MVFGLHFHAYDYTIFIWKEKSVKDFEWLQNKEFTNSEKQKKGKS